MGYELKKNTLQFYEFSAVCSVVHEESADMIVPDFCPDVARILTADAVPLIKGKDLQGDRATVSGLIKLTVLYVPEGEDGVRSFLTSIPFTLTTSFKDFEGCHTLFACLKARTIDTNLLNSRKIFCRVTLEAALKGFRQKKYSFCDSIEGREDYGIEIKCREKTIEAVTAYCEKDISFTEELPLARDLDGAVEVLSAGVHPQITELKPYGNKLILKGLAMVEFLYLTEDHRILTAKGEFPFSQIFDIDEVPEDARADVCFHFSELEYHIGSERNPEDVHCISFGLTLPCQAVVYSKIPISYICDLYSIKYSMTPHVLHLNCSSASKELRQRSEMQQLLEIGMAPEEILFKTLFFDEVYSSREGDTVLLQTNAHVKVLCRDENGLPMMVERQIECSCRLDVPQDQVFDGRMEYLGDLTASAVRAGIDLRFSIDFIAQAAEAAELSVLTDLELDEEHPKDLSKVPSLVLRFYEQEDTLWSVAKRYATSVDAIKAANELTDETELSCGKLLLIPRKV